MENAQKWLGEGVKRLLDPGSKGLRRVFCTTQPHVAPVQEACCLLGPKYLLRPLQTTLGIFPFQPFSQVPDFTFSEPGSERKVLTKET